MYRARQNVGVERSKIPIREVARKIKLGTVHGVDVIPRQHPYWIQSWPTFSRAMRDFQQTICSIMSHVRRSSSQGFVVTPKMWNSFREIWVIGAWRSNNAIICVVTHSMLGIQLEFKFISWNLFYCLVKITSRICINIKLSNECVTF